MLQSLFSNDKYTNWTYLDMINAINFLLDNIYVRFGNSLSTSSWYSYGYKLRPTYSRPISLLLRVTIHG